MNEPRAWVLNLDAEHELEAGQRYAPTQHLEALVARERERLIGTLVQPGDVVLTGDEDSPVKGLEGVAWSPTPRALARLADAGARLPDAPSVEVLRAVNARPFAALVRAPLAEASFEKHVAPHLEAVLARLAQPAPDGWLVRRTFGAAGRGRRRIAPGSPTASETAWLVASLRRGPLVVEPWVEVTQEFTRSGLVRANGEVVLSAPGIQYTNQHGAWLGTDPAASDDLSRGIDARLATAADCAGRALAAAGYFGPFGIDAYLHRWESRVVLNPMSEINARFTMDFAPLS